MNTPATVTIRVNDVAALRALDGFARKMNDIGRKMQSIGRQMALAGGATSAPFGLSVKTFADTDDALRAVGAVAEATDDEMKGLRETAKSFRTFAPRDVAAEMLKLAQAGLSAKDSMEAVASSLALQRIDPELGNQASEIVTKIAVPFGKSARDYEHIADVLAIASARSTTSVGNLGIAMGYAANQGELAGLSIEQSAAAMAILADSGIDASRAGTNLRGILSVLVAKQEKFAKLGVRILDGAGNVRKIEDIFRDLNRALDGMGGGERLAALVGVFGKLYSGGASALLKDADRFDSLVKEMERAEGVAMRWATAMDAGAGGALRSLFATLKKIGDSVGKTLEEPLQKIAEKFEAVGKSAQVYIEANPKLVQALAATASATLAVGTSAIAAGYSIQVMSAASTTLLATTARLLPLLKAIPAINLRSAATATIAAAAYTALAVAKTAAAVAGAGLALAPAALAALAIVGGTALRVGLALGAMKFGEDFSNQSGAMRIAMRGLSSAAEFLTKAFHRTNAVIYGVVVGIGTNLRDAFATVVKYLDPREALALIARVVKDFIGILGGLTTEAVRIAGALLEPFVKIASRIAEIVAPIVTKVVQSAIPYVIEAASLLVDAVAPVVDAFAYALGKIGDFAAFLLSPVVEAIAWVGSLVAKIATNMSAPFIAAFKIAGSSVADFAIGTGQFFSELVAHASGAASRLGAVFTDAMGSIGESVKVIVELVKLGEIGIAFEVAGDAAKAAFDVAIAAISVEWEKFVHFVASSFDKAILAILDKIAKAGQEMRNATAPLARGLDAVLGTDLHGALLSGTQDFTQEIARFKQAISLESQKANDEHAVRLAEREAALARAQQALRGVADNGRLKLDAARVEKELRDALAMFRDGLSRSGFSLKGSLSATALDAAGNIGRMIGEGLAAASDYMSGPLDKTLESVAAEARFLQSQVFGGAAKQLIGLEKDDLGSRTLDESKKHTELLKGIDEGIDDLELGLL